MSEVVVSWYGNAGSSDVILAPGRYRLVPEAVKVVTGALDHEYHMTSPEVSVAKVTRSTWEVARGDGFYDTVETVTLGNSLDPKGFVVAVAGEYRLTRGSGTVSLVRDATA
jgi:hypothetical protein